MVIKQTLKEMLKDAINICYLKLKFKKMDDIMLAQFVTRMFYEGYRKVAPDMEGQEYQMIRYEIADEIAEWVENINGNYDKKLIADRIREHYKVNGGTKQK